MKILWLHQYFATPEGWGAVRTYEFARRFVKSGHSVDVVCSAGYDASLAPAGREPVVVGGVRAFVSGTAYRPHMGFARRLWSFVRFMFETLLFVVRHGREYDVMIASSGPLTLAVPALAGLGLRRLPFVFEVIDVWPDSAIAAGVLRNPVLKWLSFRLEALAYRHASAIVTCSTGMTARVERKIGTEGEPARPRVATISNCCDLEAFAPDAERRRSTRARWGVGEDATVVLYAGAMGRSNAVEDLVGAIKGTADESRIVWWFAGDGAQAGRLKREAGQEGGRCRFFGKLSKSELVDLFDAADVNVVTFMHDPLFDENSPNKFFDGIAAGLPAVFNRSTWLEPLLQAYGCGLVCRGERPGLEMAAALAGLAKDRGLLSRMALGARRLAEEVFSRDKLAEDYLAVLSNVRRGAK